MGVRAKDPDTVGSDSREPDAPSDVESRTTAGRTLWAVVGVAAVVLVYVNRHQWFGGDEWFILTDRGLTAGPGHLGLFEPHYEHWTTVPILAFRALYAVVGLHSYMPYIALVIVVHLATVVLLWHVMVRSRVDPWVALAFVAVFSVLGTGFENLTTAWQVTLVAPIALGLGALLVVPESGRFSRRDALAAGLMTIAMMCSGVALPMLLSVALVALVRRGWRVAATTAVVPATAYAIWYLAYGRDGPAVAPTAPRAVPRFVWDGITNALGDVARLEFIGVIVVLAVGAWLVVQLFRRPVDPHLLVPVALAIGAVAFLAGTGYRRGNLFGSDPAESRYAYVTIAFLLPLIALAAQGLFRGNVWRRVVLVLLAVVLVVAQARKLDHQTDLARPGKDSDRGALLATAALAREGRKFLLSHPLNAFEPQVTVGEIVRMDHDGKLPPLDEATVADRLTALARLDLFVGPDPLVPVNQVAHVESSRNLDLTPDADGCLSVRARPGNELVLRVDRPGTFRVRGDGLIGLKLRDAATHADSEIVNFALPANREQVVSVATTDGLLVVSLPTDHPTVVCDVVQ